MFEFKSRPLGRPATSKEIAELTKAIQKPRTPEQRRRLLKASGILDENGNLNKDLYPDMDI